MAIWPASFTSMIPSPLNRNASSAFGAEPHRRRRLQKLADDMRRVGLASSSYSLQQQWARLAKGQRRLRSASLPCAVIGSGPCLPFISSALRPRWTYRSFRMKPTKTGARLLRARATRIGNDYDANHRRRPSARLARRPFGEIPSPLLFLWAGLSGEMPATSKIPFRRLTGLSCPRQKHGIGKPARGHLSRQTTPADMAGRRRGSGEVAAPRFGYRVDRAFTAARSSVFANRSVPLRRANSLSD